MSINTLFGCCSLRTGTIIWGTITLVSIFFSNHLLLFLLQNNEFIFQILDTLILAAIITILTKWENDYSLYWGFSCIPFIIDQIASLGLIFGAVKETPNWILLWLIVNGLIIACFMIVVVLIGFYIGYTCTLMMCLGKNIIYSDLKSIIIFFVLGILVYDWASVLAYYKTLKEAAFGNSSMMYSSVVFNKV